MKVCIQKTESQLFHGNVIQVDGWKNAGEIISGEAGLIKKYKPVYIFCTLESTDIKNIQLLEQNGYGFSEFRIHSWLQTGPDQSANETVFPNELSLIGDEDHLEVVKEILITQLPDDRFFNDPLMDKSIARDRELINIEKSFHSWPKEFILGLFNTQTNKLIAFRSGAFRNDREADFYLYGVDPKYDKEHYSRLLDHLCIDFLQKRGVNIIHAVSTGCNTDELNRLVKHHGFLISSTEVLMRKVFS
jgi:hypothetical protein